MLNRNNNLSPIPFYYESLDEQFHRRFGEYYKNLVGQSLIPFCVSISGNITISSVDIKDACGNVISGKGATLSPYIARLYQDNVTTFYFTSPNGLDMKLDRGFYYIELGLSDNTTLYSELFYVCDANDIGLSLQYYDKEDIELPLGGIIPYNHDNSGKYYGGMLYLDAKIGMPEYTKTEDGEERDGHFFPTKIISEKQYKFKAVLPEYLCDAIRIAPLSDVIKIEDSNGIEYDVEHLEIDVNWLEGGYFAEVEFTFETDTIIKKIAQSYGVIPSR